MHIFSFGGHSTADVTLFFVGIKHLPYLPVKCPVTSRQSVLQILMYRGLGYSEFTGSTSYGRPGFDHVHSQFASSLINCIGHNLPSLVCAAKKRLCGISDKYAALT